MGRGGTLGTLQMDIWLENKNKTKQNTTKSRFPVLRRSLNIFYIKVLGNRQNYLLNGSIDSEVKAI